ncbi:TRAP transporter small permease subunit [Rhodobacter sphaeroides]|jgi:TRAP-type mannitol/chloroaromatic compound transport system permease small subunit|uniref:TRAP transporter small permease protein n=2 Tax=Cereibacter sphaeroides TaxID=1063 RepID=Q3J408_CERS4|nr:TRAP transporter small permease subunit [Cereibacter sphaeroides]ABA78476.1 TRAP-T family transporter, DctQ (4TMs) subunit [Cereibacter sphaeroides 2.4.1]ACM00504.1 Tripartite ATP-independent periplasmic transporter, DctQ component precursor [Cereibacter sphaeroides KD131]AMJ46828.1 C4-dicarboxylate ABC transporter [Cereibacter sphaeroides]ANS33541.1 C4-dicarboxylate ABC transporter [Cereibacter sphaeroides]ATN62584.1 C4-dicarboxylate ABC transporter [Cereibacter sphaeroides]
MPRALVAFVRLVDRLNYGIGRFAMYLLFVLMGVLLWSSVSKVFFNPSLWTLEMAQFVMVAYFILGGPYSLQMGSHVRMDLLYADWPLRKKSWWDAITIFAVILYLGVMLWGAVDSTLYSLQYNERSPTAWRPYLWPIKIVMCVGFVLMILQCLAILVRDIATLRGKTI